jgi:cytidine deaminase
MTNKELLQIATEAASFAYAPYSNFKVGAAILTVNGKVYTGCNIENASYGATNCAERTAIFKAISEGETKFEKIAVVNVKGGITQPCGICRQVLSEFMPNGKVVLEDYEHNEIVFEMDKDILPNAFKL